MFKYMLARMSTATRSVNRTAPYRTYHQWRLTEFLGKVGLVGEASTTSRRALDISRQLAHNDARLYNEHMISITIKYAKLRPPFGHADEKQYQPVKYPSTSIS